MRLLGLLWLLAAGAAVAEALPDPTRPPAGYVPAAQGGGTADTGPRLQSVMLPKRGKPTAVISGQVVSLGDKVGDGRLARLTEGEAVIVGPQGVERLRLTPEVEKVMVQEKSGNRAPGGQRKRHEQK